MVFKIGKAEEFNYNTIFYHRFFFSLFDRFEMDRVLKPSLIIMLNKRRLLLSVAYLKWLFMCVKISTYRSHGIAQGDMNGRFILFLEIGQFINRITISALLNAFWVPIFPTKSKQSIIITENDFIRERKKQTN